MLLEAHLTFLCLILCRHNLHQSFHLFPINF